MTCKERVLAIESDGADESLHRVGVNLYAAICQECLQAVPLVMDIGELFSQTGFGGYLATLCLKPFPEGRYQGRGAGLAGGEALTPMMVAV